ncbi:Aspartic-type endopeptidase ctsD [Cyberlindnera fabianii]|uniref:Aspartic-type endopeptidase ctsD n=1 Tax=Cyberlindnera fabianii TaxID=36022 RepID=A0A1V2LD13_CYBFA|nr:Aspartic-type endopeptidase ctsD [Cyberlindnera fabianii]
MLLKTSLIVAFASTVTALMPFQADRFITTDDYVKVSSVQDVPAGYRKHLATLGSTTGKTASVVMKPYEVNSTKSSTVLNIVPGISLLETDENNECYYVNTTIGTKEFPLIIDTGSAYLWVYGSECTEKACEDEAVYTPSSESTTATSTFALAYVTGTASGDVVEDNIIVNKLATTQKFRFGMAATVPDFFSNYPVSGIFGLPSNDSSSIESIISALYDSHAIDTKRFSISLGQVGSNKSEYSNAGIFAIGKPIEELYTGEIHYTPLLETESLYWQVVISGVSVDSYGVTFNESIEINGTKSTSKRTAIVDSGTTVLALPAQDALDIHTYFPESITDGTNFAIFCNSSLDITLTLNNHNYTIGPEQYLGQAYDNDSSYAGYCVSNIQGVSSDTVDSWILGAVFLKTVYADFDVENQQIGFASRNENVELTSTATSVSSASGTAAATTLSTSTSAKNSSSNSTSSYKDAAVGTAAGLSICSFLIPALVAVLL